MRVCARVQALVRVRVRMRVCVCIAVWWVQEVCVMLFGFLPFLSIGRAPALPVAASRTSRSATSTVHARGAASIVLQDASAKNQVVLKHEP